MEFSNRSVIRSEQELEKEISFVAMPSTEEVLDKAAELLDYRPDHGKNDQLKVKESFEAQLSREAHEGVLVSDALAKVGLERLSGEDLSKVCATMRDDAAIQFDGDRKKRWVRRRAILDLAVYTACPVGIMSTVVGLAFNFELQRAWIIALFSLGFAGVAVMLFCYFLRNVWAPLNFEWRRSHISDLKQHMVWAETLHRLIRLSELFGNAIEFSVEFLQASRDSDKVYVQQTLIVMHAFGKDYYLKPLNRMN